MCIRDSTYTMELTTFDKIYRKHYAEVLNYINFKVQNFELAEELTNDTFLKVHKYLATFDAEKSKLTTWLRNISNTCISDHFRVDHTENEVCISDFVSSESGKEVFQIHADSEADNLVESKEFNTNIAKVFRRLKPKYRKVATLYFLREKEYSEIAEICEIPMGSVKGMISRCREMLQKELQREKREYAIA